jgi:nucleoside-diphosphate-sugar epimerase
MVSKRIVVTGGAGFLGSHLCDRLLDTGAEVICLDNFFTLGRSSAQQESANLNIQVRWGNKREGATRRNKRFPPMSAG